MDAPTNSNAIENPDIITGSKGLAIRESIYSAAEELLNDFCPWEAVGKECPGLLSHDHDCVYKHVCMEWHNGKSCSKLLDATGMKHRHDNAVHILKTCVSVAKGEDCKFGDRCEFGHDHPHIRRELNRRRREAIKKSPNPPKRERRQIRKGHREAKRDGKQEKRRRQKASLRDRQNARRP
ncbi:hypothetical protein NA57DRAFT_78670 [Rhizodiscina lignyota]|uniref:C3H1-type domain-containing protein n=1 Tax=Rhizodiscina lignyota TaxID=1504668 RepID=A0A9P4IAW5_9PEZI|nr:hypothetical protein NA57DRAFT_78670 [Rhizodiscina lignyota]